MKVRSANKKGFEEIKNGGVFNGAFPTSNTRRGRVIDYGNISPTIQANNMENYCIEDISAVRQLTPRECFRLQGFPDDYFERAAKVSSDNQLYKQAGNSVTVNVIYEIAKRIGG